MSHLIRSEIDGEPLSEVQLLNYCELIVEAGNRDDPQCHQWRTSGVRRSPSRVGTAEGTTDLLPSAVEEILRWVSPIIHFVRTATEDCELEGIPISSGRRWPCSTLLLTATRRSSGSVTFRVDRRPNPHMAFGMGEHFCMGAHLARLELETVFRHLLTRLEWFELDGPPDRLNSAVNGGIKHLPLHCQLL